MNDLLNNRPSMDYVARGRESADRFFDRLHRLHGKQAAAYLHGLTRPAVPQPSERYLFRLFITRADKH